MVLPVSELREVAAFARRSGNTWFVAITNGPTARNVQVNLAEILSRAQAAQTGQAEQARGGRAAAYHPRCCATPTNRRP